MSRTGKLASAFRLPPRRTLQLRLAFLYGGFFFVCGVAVLLVPVFTIKSRCSPWPAVSAGLSKGSPLISPTSPGKRSWTATRKPSAGMAHEGATERSSSLASAIVRAIASAHGATLTAKARPEGCLDIEVSFREPQP